MYYGQSMPRLVGSVVLGSGTHLVVDYWRVQNDLDLFGAKVKKKLRKVPIVSSDLDAVFLFRFCAKQFQTISHTPIVLNGSDD